MSTPLLLPLSGNEVMAALLGAQLGYECGQIETRKFPDGETYLKIDGDLKGRFIVLVCTLDRPDDKFLPSVFAADAARELGATSVGLVAPYLAYMRQDRRFQRGEAVTSHSFARLLSSTFNWLVTIDPHLHRYKSLSELYTVPATAIHAAPLLAGWIGTNIENPVLIGPDAESAQWVSAAATRIGVPFTVLEKMRAGDRDVSVQLRNPAVIAGRTPVLLDDIISSGETMLAAIRAVRPVTATNPVCVAVHGIFADQSYERLAAEGAQVVTSNTIAHATNAIDTSGMLADAVKVLLSGETGLR